MVLVARFVVDAVVLGFDMVCVFVTMGGVYCTETSMGSGVGFL